MRQIIIEYELAADYSAQTQAAGWGPPATGRFCLASTRKLSPSSERKLKSCRSPASAKTTSSVVMASSTLMVAKPTRLVITWPFAITKLKVLLFRGDVETLERIFRDPHVFAARIDPNFRNAPRLDRLDGSTLLRKHRTCRSVSVSWFEALPESYAVETSAAAQMSARGSSAARDEPMPIAPYAAGGRAVRPFRIACRTHAPCS